ncbi:Alpha-methylacyl-CoA racemase-1 [Mycena indigotica]|uniref:Alpha-methylacyl-CoA racemase-1 n=1 Tax=Mycena indigotica TaxID=2126181 RepID=A0A8H6S6V0_9AGAR|nr:Alpha-methylacyl-CoA racemase-1 [Mycena indigotica]KAF7292887.1 Alpha-methylacyl-CoA racemase-1 [Mycena indigotica]
MVNSYSVPTEASRILNDGILNNPLHSDLPSSLRQLAKNVIFHGNDEPSIPMPWRFSEAVAALKALEATLVNALVEKKYHVNTGAVHINTDRANLLFMAALLTRVDPEGANALLPPGTDPFIKNKDYHGALGSDHRRAATNLYRAKDGRYIQIHGGMNPDITLTALGLPLESDKKGVDATKMVADVVSLYNAGDLEELLVHKFKQAAAVASTVQQFLDSDQGKANAHVGLFQVHRITDPSQRPGWWPEAPSFPSSPQRPLAGLKVVDLTWVIAAPSLTRSLAEYGASVMRVTAGHLCDYSALHAELNWGKWNSELDLRIQEHREKLKALILDADVVVVGYRPLVLEKYGFGKDAVLELIKQSGRERGIVYARVNCHGWNGPLANRPGWQQISDTSTGIAMGFAEAMGMCDGEAVVSLFPTADYCAGLSGASGVLQALLERNENGGSYVVDVALNYFNVWLARSCGQYPKGVWEELRKLHDFPTFAPEENLPGLSFRCIQMLMRNAPGRIIRSDWLEDRQSSAIGVKVRTVKPIAEWEETADGGQGVQSGFNVGTRGNGVDAAEWPDDLRVEIVTAT